MAVRVFDGSDDQITLDDGGLGAIANGAFSIVLIAKPTALAAFESFFGAKGGGTHLAGLYDGGGGKIAFASSAAFGDYFGAGMTAGDWQILGITKTSGTTAPRTHRKQLGSGSWTHGDISGGSVANVATAATMFIVGSNDGTDYKDMRLAVAAWFPTALSDANVESIQTTSTTQKLIDLGAVAVWEFNQASTATDVTDLVGSADQTAIVGTTVATGDDPSGWTFYTPPGTPPVNTVAPAITGSTTVGSTLTCSTGTWTGSPTPTYAYQWKSGGTNISGETTSTYDTVIGDVGDNITCTVTATNTEGSDSEDSNTVVPTSLPTTNDMLVKVSGSWEAVEAKVRVSGAWL